MNSSDNRNYSMQNRSKAAAKNEQRILSALAELFIEESLRDITLEKISEKSGVTVRTILRKFGSKEGLFMATKDIDIAGIQSIKNTTRVGDLDHAVDTLLQEYELTGKAGIRLLSLEQEMALAAMFLKKGRKVHMEWVERVFAPYLPHEQVARRSMLGALYVETDINGWRLLRLDLGYSLEETREIMLKKIKGAIYAYKNNL
jgi:AcrR family transcriptional regulator